MLGLLLYFALGVISDLLVTGYYLCVGKDWALYAAALSYPIGLMPFYSLKFFNPTESQAHAFAAGNSVGCFMIMMFIRRRLRSDRT